MKYRSVLILIVFFQASVGFAFVPPLGAIFKANFEGRRSAPQETLIRHQVLLRNGESLSLEERFVKLNGKVYLIFKSPVYGEVAATWGKTGYLFGSDKKIPSRSQAFLTYFTTQQPDVFREVLIDEKLIKRDQFLQYKNSFAPEGDPAQWNLSENYVVQPEVFFSRTPAGPSIIAVGLEEGTARRAVFFEKGSLILSRIEWKNDKEVTAWNFAEAQKIIKDGVFPRELFFQVDEKEVVRSQLISRNPVEEKSKKQWLARFSSLSKNTLNPSLEDALRILLGYR